MALKLFFCCILQTCALQQSEPVGFSDMLTWGCRDVLIFAFDREWIWPWVSAFFFLCWWICLHELVFLHLSCVRARLLVCACVCVDVYVYVCACVSEPANGLVDCAQQNLTGQSMFVWYKKRNLLLWCPFNLMKYEKVNSFFLQVPCIYYIPMDIIICLKPLKREIKNADICKHTLSIYFKCNEIHWYSYITKV